MNGKSKGICGVLRNIHLEDVVIALLRKAGDDLLHGHGIGDLAVHVLQHGVLSMRRV